MSLLEIKALFQNYHYQCGVARVPCALVWGKKLFCAPVNKDYRV